jgi:hypothetical protein
MEQIKKGFLITGIDVSGKRFSVDTYTPEYYNVIHGNLYHYRQNKNKTERKLCARITQGVRVFTNYGRAMVM